MARIEDLLTDVEDAELRASLADEVKRLKRQVRFGLVFERHLPESVLLGGDITVHVGDRVRLRKEPGNRATWLVEGFRGKTATIRPTNGAANGSTKTRQTALGDLLVVRDFGDPIFPSLTSVGSVRGSNDRPYHAVINAENYHAIQALIYAYEGQADCLYLDPPFNTGAKDWRYNNDYVDGGDAWRHSKWLSFMEKRLRLARRLLKHDGAIVVLIDEHEVHHLGVLLEDLFPDAYRQVVTLVTNPKGATRGHFSRVEEFAYFVFFGNAGITSIGDDLLSPEADLPKDDDRPRWKGLLRSGTNARRRDRPNLFYPVLIDPKRGAVVGTGEPLLPLSKKPNLTAKVSGYAAAWPVRKDGSLGNWGVGHITLRQLIEKGYVSVGDYDDKRRTWGLSYLGATLREQVETGVLVIKTFDHKRNVVDVRYVEERERRVKTVWRRSAHDAGAYGTGVVRSFLGGDRSFPFPKSLYAVRDSLAAIVGNKPDALIIDFFAGSGTTLHATALLNAADNGRRRCLLVTNNEVDEERAEELHGSGYFAGDPEFEQHGIFEAICKPRCEAAITGRTPQGQPVSGSYLDGRVYADGVEENIEFLRLDYLDADDVELGRCFAEIHPLLWLRAGSCAPRPELNPNAGPFTIVEECGYAVLFDETALREFVVALKDAPRVEHVFLVTDSEDAFSEMCGEVGAGYQPEMLYRDYSRAFRSFASRP